MNYRNLFLPLFIIIGFFGAIPSAHAAITITAPTAGTSWQAGTTHTISWTGGGSWVTRIYLNTPTAWASTVVTSISNTGSYSWTIPGSVAPATNYLVYVETATCNGCAASDWVYGPQFTVAAAASNAAFVSQTSPPSTMATGQVATVSVTMQNTGGDTWVQGGSNPYRLGSQNPQDNVTWGSSRTNLPVATVASGASVTFNFTVTAPSTPGVYNFQRRMLQEGITWFGAFSTNVAVTVTAPDTTPPVISGVAASGITTNSATITWTTNEVSDSRVEYGLTSAYGSAISVAESVTSHSQGLSGLSAGTLYHYRVRSRDAALNTSYSPDSTFTTTSAPDGIPPTPPTVSLGSATQSSLIANWVGATDNVAVTGYRLDVSTAGTFATFVAGYNNLDVGNVLSRLISGLNPSTTYYARVRAYDAAGYTSANSNVPSLATTAPPPPPNVSGYAWGGNPDVDGIGWIHLSGNATDGSPYGVLVSSANPGVMSGYAWANPNDAVAGTNNIGWIDFAPAGSYPVSSFVPAQSARMNRTTGLVTGWARACSVFASGCSGALKADTERGGWDGWIGFGSDGNYTQPVTVSGCNWSGYAWGGGTALGWIHFGGALYPVTGSGDGCTTSADLTAGNVSPTSATANTPTIVSSTISNIGIGTTGAGFTNLFQFDNNADHAAVTGTMTDTSPAVAAGGTDVSQVSYTFATSGTWYVRACSDNNASFVGTIAESNESNNCGEWTDVTVTLPLLAGTFSANPDTIDPGQSSTLTWTSNATACTETGPPAAFSTGSGSPANGSAVVTPTTPGSINGYQIICSKSGYTPLTLATTVTVISVTASISASPTCVRGGGSSTLKWSATPASQIASCTISSNPTGPGFPITQSTPGPFSGQQTATVPNTTSTYTIDCTTNGGSHVTKSVIVKTSSCLGTF